MTRPSRAVLASAQLIAVLAWASTSAVASTAVMLGLGALLGLSTGTPGPGLARVLVGALLTALLALPFALAATIGRSALAGVGTVIGIIVVTQISPSSVSGRGSPTPPPACGSAWADPTRPQPWNTAARAAPRRSRMGRNRALVATRRTYSPDQRGDAPDMTQAQQARASHEPHSAAIYGLGLHVGQRAAGIRHSAEPP